MTVSSDKYFEQLEFQIAVNQEQLHELQSLLRVERLKIYTYFTFIIILAFLVGIVAYGVLGGRIDYRFEHSAAAINIGAVFALFGLFEVLTFLTDALSLSARLRRLVSRQLEAVNEASALLNLSDRG